MAKASGLDWILTENALGEVLRPLALESGSSVRGILFPLEAELPPTGRPSCVDESPDAPCLLQHSSGTTGLQKAVVLSNRAILEHARTYSGAIHLSPDDRVVSWLPLYHDMGLIAAFHVPLVAGVPTVQLDPFEWVQFPSLLLEQISSERGTLTWLPNFAYNLMADRIHDDEIESIRLDSLRMAVNCSEPVRAESHDRFYARFSRLGLRREALSASYAMAETTFAVTQVPPGSEARRLSTDRDALAQGNAEPPASEGATRWCVSSGTVVEGCEIRIMDETGVELPRRGVGEIAIRSTSMFDGYRNRPDKTAEVVRDGWFLSGDLGFCDGADLFVIGRKKDLIIVAGRNIYPEDVEDVVSGVVGVLPGRVVAFSFDEYALGTEGIGVVAETNVAADAERMALERAIVEAGMSIDVTIERVYLVQARWLIKSSAGKPSRRANAARILGREWRDEGLLA
jgi:fatty-acyl-CoA synthase